MSGSINKVILVGNLGRDPEARSTQDGRRVVSLTVATSDNWRDKVSGERKERVEWHRVSIWNERLAEVAEKYLRKGAKVYLEGQLQTRKWEQNGEDRYSTEIVLQQYKGELTMLDSASAGNGDDDRPQQSGGRNAYANRRGGGSASVGGQHVGKPLNDLDDDIPF